MRVGILTDFPSAAVQSGPAIHTRFLHDGLTSRGHDVTLIGPDTTNVASTGGVKTHLIKGIPYPSHPNIKIPVPQPLGQIAAPPEVDVVHGQVNHHMMELGTWMRRLYGCAVLNTNTVHLPTHSHFILSDELYKSDFIRNLAEGWADDLERDYARMYNDGDALIVQSRYMVEYWRNRGVTVPIEVVGRPIDPSKFSSQPEADPFPANFAVGKRLIVVCRQDREKNLPTLLDIFDRHIADADPEVTLTLVGAGHDSANLEKLARRKRHADRIHFAGEVAHGRLVDWYSHADVFVYTSLSETFGNVVNEALWSGVPVVALDDEKGVAHQVLHEENGYLVKPNRVDTEERFARYALSLIGHRNLRRRLGQNAANIARRISHPDVVIRRFEQIYDRAITRVRAENNEPLRGLGPVRRRIALAGHAARWARWNYSLLLAGTTLGKFGFGREDHVSKVETRTEHAPSAVEANIAEAIAQAAE